jgi:CheY-like chemotaxis protein
MLNSLGLFPIHVSSGNQEPRRKRTGYESRFAPESQIQIAIPKASPQSGGEYIPYSIQALRVLEDIEPDLIISDIDIPYMLGVEFTALLKNNPNTWAIPTILCSIDYDISDPDSTLRTKADAILEKPFSSRRLSLVLEQLLPNWQKVHQNSMHPSMPTGWLQSHMLATASQLISPRSLATPAQNLN